MFIGIAAIFSYLKTIHEQYISKNQFYNTTLYLFIFYPKNLYVPHAMLVNF